MVAADFTGDGALDFAVSQFQRKRLSPISTTTACMTDDCWHVCHGEERRKPIGLPPQGQHLVTSAPKHRTRDAR